jgi:hypothetical protein
MRLVHLKHSVLPVLYPRLEQIAARPLHPLRILRRVTSSASSTGGRSTKKPSLEEVCRLDRPCFAQTGQKRPPPPAGLAASHLAAADRVELEFFCWREVSPPERRQSETQMSQKETRVRVVLPRAQEYQPGATATRGT